VQEENVFRCPHIDQPFPVSWHNGNETKVRVDYIEYSHPTPISAHHTDLLTNDMQQDIHQLLHQYTVTHVKFQ